MPFSPILRPRSSIGWLLLVSGACLVFGFSGPEYVKRSIILGSELPGYRLMDWLYPTIQGLGFIILLLWLPLLFPDGLLPGPRWRRIAWVAGIVTVLSAALQLVLDDADEYGRSLPNPMALDGANAAVAQLAYDAMTVATIGFIALALGSVMLRFRRSRGAVRQQMKWFLAAASLAFVSLIVMAISMSDSAFFVTLAVVGLIPIAIGIAVLRYRLYEIDRIISRTIGWAVVTGMLVGAFALLVLGSTAVLEPLTGGNTLAVAGSTLVVALLFAPLRARVQRQVDRRFDRSRYDGERTLAAFGERLRDEVDLSTIRADVLATVDHSVRPSSVGLWLRGPEERA